MGQESFMDHQRLDGAARDASLTHRVILPRAAGDDAPPGLLVLHGRGADESDLLSLAPALDPRLVIVAARAPFQLGPGFHWYDLLAIGRPEPESFGRSRELLGRFLGEIVDGYGIDPKRLFLLGFSQGAMMSGSLLLMQPGAIAGAVLLSGYLPLHAGLTIDPEAVRGKPVFVRHGTRDVVIPVEFGRESREFLSAAGAALDYGEYPIGHQISEQELRDVAAWITGRLDGAPPSAADSGGDAPTSNSPVRASSDAGRDRQRQDAR